MADRSPSSRATGGLRRLLLLPLLLQLLAVGTLVVGRDTLVLRDVLATHLPMKQAQALAMRQGELPELDVYRGGGQPLLGNPNGAPFYPTNALYLVAPPIWALNAHLWLHFLIAPWSLAWLARRLGCSRAAAWVGGAVYATSGWFLSQTSFYDLVPAAALAPAFVAACLAARDGAGAGARRARGGWRAAAAAGGLWALLLLGGDPAVAALTLVAAALALLLVRPRVDDATHGADGDAARGEESEAGDELSTRTGAGDAEGDALVHDRATRGGAGLAARWLPLLLALACGTALALPQIVELLRILPTSTRGVRGYDATASTVGSWDPRQAIEQLLPLPFGRVDRAGPGGFWGQRFHTGMLPLFITLYPGLLPLGLAAAAGRARGRGGAFAWTALGLGLFVALGRFNPLVAALAALPAGGVVRFPVKAWLLVAVGLSTLAAVGWQRAIDEGDAAAARRLRATLLALAAVLLVAAVVAFAAHEPLQAWMESVLPRAAPRSLVAGEARRWALTLAGLAGLAGTLAALLERRASAAAKDATVATAASAAPAVASLAAASNAPAVAPMMAMPAGPGSALAAVALSLHVGAQLLLLAPATMARDRVSPYTRAPAFAAALPAGTTVAHGSVSRLFGPFPRRAAPHGEGRWLTRQAAAAGQPLVGVPLGWRYELAASPEGLDGFLTRLALEAVKASDDARRVRLLRVWGVEALLLERPLATGTDGAQLVTTARGPLADVLLYRIEGATTEVRRVAGARRAADPRAAIAALLDPGFDARTEVVLPGGGPPTPGGRGATRTVRAGIEALDIITDGARTGWIVVQRAWQPHWRASVDGRPAEVTAADLHRLAVAVPAGAHEVRLWVDRRPLLRSALAAAVGLLGLLGLLAMGLRGRRPPLPS
jgi:hypothetical protein